jgi:hypothetical protein
MSELYEAFSQLDIVLVPTFIVKLKKSVILEWRKRDMNILENILSDMRSQYGADCTPLDQISSINNKNLFF